METVGYMEENNGKVLLFKAEETDSFRYWDDALRELKGQVSKERWELHRKNGDIIIFSSTDPDQLRGARKAAKKYRCILQYIDHKQSTTHKSLRCFVDIFEQYGKQEFSRLIADGSIVRKTESYI